MTKKSLQSKGSTNKGLGKKGSKNKISPVKKVYPRRAYGFFRRLKWLILFTTLSIYYLIPWVRWDRGDSVWHKQAVMLDFPQRHFYFFGIDLWPQDFFIILLLGIFLIFGLFWVSIVFGRIWCGYLCPQTVWTDLFIAVERWVEGNRNARIKLDRKGWTFEKIRKKVLKHFLWIIISILTGGAFVFYFYDAPTLARSFWTFSAPVTAYVFLIVFTLTTYALAGWARHLFCVNMCPWPRIQATFIDDQSFAVTYRKDRGEPRGAKKKTTQVQALDLRGENAETVDRKGDCIDCHLCVQVCPMGIDIRDGLQLSCIQCALCIDACNSIMDRVSLPRGLIAYDTDRVYSAEEKKPNLLRKLLRARSVIYGALTFLVLGWLVSILGQMPSFEGSIFHERKPAFVRLKDGSIQNRYSLRLSNKTFESQSYKLVLKGFNTEESVKFQLKRAGKLLNPEDFSLQGNKIEDFAVTLTLFKQPEDLERRKITFILEEQGAEQAEISQTFVFAH